MEITADHLYGVIGRQQVQILVLQQNLTAAQKELAAAKEVPQDTKKS